MEPGSDSAFRNRIETSLRPYVGNTGFVDPRRLQGEALALYVSIYRDFWRSVLPLEAFDALSNVNSYGEFVAWRRGSGFYDGRRRVRFAVSEVFAGDVGKTVDIYTGLGGGTACVPFFEAGEEYLVFASGSAEEWHTSTCAGTRSTAEAEKALQYLRGYASAGPLGSFAGVAYERNWNSEGYSEISMADGAEIEVSSEEGSWTTRTDQDGRFSISDLQPGRYFISGQYQDRPLSLGPAGIPGTEPIQTVPARGCAFVRFTRHAPSGVVSGLVVGPANEPMLGILVDAVPTTGKFSGRRTRTDQNGEFEINELQPGGYFIGININGPPSPYLPYAALYYPGVPTKESASVLQVSDGLEALAGTLTLGPPMGVRKIRGKVVDADGNPLSGVRVGLVPEGSPYGVSDYRTSEDGIFELEGLEGTPYVARAEMQDPRNGSMAKTEVAAPVDAEASITIVLTFGPTRPSTLPAQ